MNHTTYIERTTLQAVLQYPLPSARARMMGSHWHTSVQDAYLAACAIGNRILASEADIEELLGEQGIWIRR